MQVLYSIYYILLGNCFIFKFIMQDNCICFYCVFLTNNSISLVNSFLNSSKKERVLIVFGTSVYHVPSAVQLLLKITNLISFIFYSSSKSTTATAFLKLMPAAQYVRVLILVISCFPNLTSSINLSNLSNLSISSA